MYIIVVGLGQVGRHVVRTLEWEKHDVVAVDVDSAAIDYIEEHHDVMTLRGYGASLKTLQDAGVRKADLLVAVTSNDEVNLIAALAAKQLGVKRTVARVQSRDWAMDADQDSPLGVQYGLLGVDVVFNPMVLLAKEVAKIAASRGALEVLGIANDMVEVVQIELDASCELLHKQLAKLSLPSDILIAAVVRNDTLFVPRGNDALQPNDRIYLVGLPQQMAEAQDLFTRGKEARRVCIVGGGVVGAALAQLLLASGTEAMIIERDADRAQELATRLEGVTVVHGDGTDLTLLNEERVQNYDLFVACSHEDEVNLMAALLAKRMGLARTATVVHRPEYVEIYRQLGIDVVLSPRTVASEHVLRHCRNRHLKGLTLIEDGQAEILEFVAKEGSKILGLPVRRLAMPPAALLVAVVRQGTVIIPGGDDWVEAEDRVVVLAMPAARRGVNLLFKGKR